MLPAAEFQQIRSDLWSWQAYDSTVKCDLCSCAIRMGKDFVFIDPIRLAGDALIELARIAKPTAILVTNANHARNSSFYRGMLQVPVMAHADACAGLAIPIDRHLVEGETPIGGLTVIAIPGAVPGEIALHFASGVMVIGDALIALEPRGFSLLPDKYCLDPNLMRTSLRKLLRFEFEVLTFAHGLPLVDRARQRLETLIA